MELCFVSFLFVAFLLLFLVIALGGLEVKGVQKNGWVRGKCHNLIFINSRRREIKWKCKIYSKNFEGKVSMIYIPTHNDGDDEYHSMMIKIIKTTNRI